MQTHLFLSSDELLMQTEGGENSLCCKKQTNGILKNVIVAFPAVSEASRRIMERGTVISKAKIKESFAVSHLCAHKNKMFSQVRVQRHFAR